MVSTAGGLMRQRFGSVSLRDSTLHLRQEVETLDGVLDGGVGWQLLKCFENLLLDADGSHPEPPIGRDRLWLSCRDNGSLLKLSDGAKPDGRPGSQFPIPGAPVAHAA